MTEMRYFFCWLLCWVLLAGMTVEEVPTPETIYQGFVTDAGGVLGPEDISRIDGLCRELEKKTTIELAVVTVDNLGGAEIHDFAERLFRRFAIGKRDRDNGLLVLLVRDDRRIKMKVGDGLKSSLTEARATHLLQTFAIPRLRKGEFGRGLYDLVKATARAVSKASRTPLQRRK